VVTDGSQGDGAGADDLINDDHGDALLINVDELAAMEPPPVLLDVRWRLGGPPGIESYQAGHVPGAVFVDLDRELSGVPGPGGRHPMPAANDFENAMRRAGVSDDSVVVVYDEADSIAAARAWWLLRYFGHRAVRVLDGGYRAWVGAGRPVSTGGRPVSTGDAPANAGTAVSARGDFTARPGHMPLLDAAGAARIADQGTLLDARAPERYRGETEPVDAVAGHIPGAVSAPTAANVRPDGTFRDAAELGRRFAGVRGPVGVYCGSGVTAAHEVLALGIGGVKDAALYLGSWSDWITDPARPVATGPGPSA
jgi:thiosulfate/3-mercaptopyruvate sulfurtransferase